MNLLREPRLHDEEFLKRIRQLPCLIPQCNATHVEAAHIRMARADLGVTEAGIGQKPHDAMVVPLCAEHHRLGLMAEHRLGSRFFWARHGIQPHCVALRLWLAHRNNPNDRLHAVQAMRTIILEERFNAG
jgi:hypothetical protein